MIQIIATGSALGGRPHRLLGLDYVAVKANYNLWFWILRAFFGFGFIYGVWLFVLDFFKLGREPVKVPAAAPVGTAA